MTPADFIALLESHDWYFDRSDDSRTYSKGLASQKRLLHLCHEQPELFRLYNHADNCIIRALPFDFQSILGSPAMVEKLHTQTPTPMKELLQSIFDTLITPLIDALDRNTAAKGGCAAPVADSPAPAAEKLAKTPKAAKPAAPPVSPVEKKEEEVEVISEARLKATVKTLANEGKIKLKAYFLNKFGYNTMAEIAPEHRADIHAVAVKIGAIDTDPEAEAEM